MLLAFDTCLDRTYIGISDNKTFSDYIIVENEGSTYHSAFLISNIREILKRNNLTPNDIKTIATDIGPGSFTGIRACMTVAKVMANQLKLKTIGISSLEILSKINQPEKQQLVLLDARKNKAYAWHNKILGAIPIEELKEKVATNEYSIITDDAMFEIFKPICKDIVSYTKIKHNLAKNIIEIANGKDSSEYKNLEPLYIQPPPIFGK